jgi:uncharacterized protein (TIGR02145 family)
MKTISFSVLTASLALAMALTFSACDGGGGSALVGRWDLVEGPAEGNPEVMELLSDGTGIVKEVSIYGRENKEGIAYKTENGRFYMTFASGDHDAESYSYKVSGSTLTLTKDDGTVLEYINVKKIKPPSFTNFTDPRDSKTYKTIKMPDGKVWFAENLNYAAEGSKCYDNKEENCQKYGRLYDWATAMEACSKGWHLPSKEEWEGLDFGNKTAGKKLKAASGWHSASGNGLDIFGFSALPGGHASSDRFSNYEIGGFWWSSSVSEHKAYTRAMYHDKDEYWELVKIEMLSIRCVKD